VPELFFEEKRKMGSRGLRKVALELRARRNVATPTTSIETIGGRFH
jgi:hypothetical protein